MYRKYEAKIFFFLLFLTKKCKLTTVSGYVTIRHFSFYTFLKKYLTNIFFLVLICKKYAWTHTFQRRSIETTRKLSKIKMFVIVLHKRLYNKKLQMIYNFNTGLHFVFVICVWNFVGEY